MFRYVIFSYFTFSLLVYVKNLLLPAILFFLIPLSDFRSTLFELIILIFGVLSCFLFFRLGYAAQNFFNANGRSMIFILHLLFLPLLFANWLTNEVWILRWNEFFVDLIAEPYRLITFSYSSSNFIGQWVPVILIAVGYLIHQYEQKREKLRKSHYPLRAERS